MAWEIWAERATSAYSGKGPAKARGYEHHVVSYGRKPTLTAEVAFENFGVTRYTVEEAGGANAQSIYRYADGLVIEGRRRGKQWSGRAIDGDVTTEFAIDLDVPAGTTVLPSMLARWLGVGTVESVGDVAEYLAVPEDGWGAFRPARKQWFPVMNAHPHTPCRVTIAPVEDVAFGRTVRAARVLVHSDGSGSQVARLLLDPESGAPLRYEQMGCVLTVVDEDRARSRLASA